jgi:glycosyltransferase involved in cell wall biosynthesis
VNIAFVLLTYASDAPAGIERSLAALAAGCRELGHRVLILTASRGTAEPGLRRLESVTLPEPAVEADLHAALADPGPVCDEVHAALARHGTHVVCWADASWGLGHLAPAPAGVRTALRVAVLRTDPLFRHALARRPDVVLANSAFLLAQARDAGYPTLGWAAVPNALLTSVTPPGMGEREALRRSGPIRIVARAEPHKGVQELIEAVPPGLGRPIEIVLATAGFEYWPGMQADLIAGCGRAAAVAPSEVRLLPALPWSQVPAFFAGATATIISTTSPETWCNAAAEALSAGTPVIGYDFGHVPALTGPAGAMVPPSRPATALWDAAQALLADREAYHAAARAAPAQVAGHTPAASAVAFLEAVFR